MSNLKLFKDEIRKNNILSIHVNLLNKCTSRCTYCRKYTWPSACLDIDVLKRTLKHLHDNLGLKTVVFSGGDPILYPHLPELLKWSYELGLKCSLITTFITKDKELIKTIAKYTYRIHISIDGATDEVYSCTRGVKNVLSLVKENITLYNSLRPDKIKVRISSTVSKLNVHQLEDLYMFAKDTGSNIKYYFIHECPELVPDADEFERHIKAVAELDTDGISNAKSILDRSFTNQSSVLKSKTCRIPYIHCLINANGDIYPCCQLLNDNGEYGPQVKYVYGNIYADDIAAEFEKRFDTTYDICKYCNGCLERYIPYIDELNYIYDVEEVLFL